MGPLKEQYMLKTRCGSANLQPRRNRQILVSSRPARSTQRDPGQPGLCRETISGRKGGRVEYYIHLTADDLLIPLPLHVLIYQVPLHAYNTTAHSWRCGLSTLLQACGLFWGSHCDHLGWGMHVYVLSQHVPLTFMTYTEIIHTFLSVTIPHLKNKKQKTSKCHVIIVTSGSSSFPHLCLL